MAAKPGHDDGAASRPRAIGPEPTTRWVRRDESLPFWPMRTSAQAALHPGSRMSDPAVSRHLAVLKNAGLVVSENRGQFGFCRLAPDNLVKTLNGYAQEVCPLSRPHKAQSADIACNGA